MGIKKPAISLSNVATVTVWEARLVKAVAGDAASTAILMVLLTVPSKMISSTLVKETVWVTFQLVVLKTSEVVEVLT